MEALRVDATIVGGGIVGLLLALKLKKKYPQWEIVVFEKEIFFGDQSSGRNSGVLHAGIYYPNGSLKHLLCLEGYRQWLELSPALNIDYKICGKYIFSSHPGQDGELQRVFEQAIKNSVKVFYASSSEKEKLSTVLNLTEAIFSPNTGILDAASAVKNIQSQASSLGVHFVTSSEIRNLRRIQSDFEIETNSYKVISPVLFNCAGLGSIQLRESLGLVDLSLYMVKGNYISTQQKLSFEHLYYPVPLKDLKGLGVHSTFDINGKINFGPNTEDITSVDYSPSTTALKQMVPEICNYFKNIDKESLYWNYAGIRTKITYAQNNELIKDFWIKNTLPGYIECLGIESPGLTSAPAIADYCINLL